MPTCGEEPTSGASPCGGAGRLQDLLPTGRPRRGGRAWRRGRWTDVQAGGRDQQSGAESCEPAPWPVGCTGTSRPCCAAKRTAADDVVGVGGLHDGGRPAFTATFHGVASRSKAGSPGRCRPPRRRARRNCSGSSVRGAAGRYGSSRSPRSGSVDDADGRAPLGGSLAAEALRLACACRPCRRRRGHRLPRPGRPAPPASMISPRSSSRIAASRSRQPLERLGGQPGPVGAPRRRPGAARCCGRSGWGCRGTSCRSRSGRSRRPRSARRRTRAARPSPGSEFGGEAGAVGQRGEVDVVHQAISGR